MDTLKPDTAYITRHDSAIEPIGVETPNGLAVQHQDYYQWLSDRYDAGERVYDMIIVDYFAIRAVWKFSMETGDFSYRTEEYYESLAAIEELIQRDKVVERYIAAFGGVAPEPILQQTGLESLPIDWSEES